VRPPTNLQLAGVNFRLLTERAVVGIVRLYRTIVQTFRRILLSSLSRGLDLVALLARERRALGLAEIAKKLEISKSSAHELLATLADHNFVQRQQGGIYQLGLRAWEVGAAASVTPLIAAAVPVMERIAAEINEDVVLGVLSGFASINVHIVGSGQAVRVYAPVGTRFPAHHASTGLLLLAFQPEGFLESVLPPSLSAASPLTITDPHKLRAELIKIRARGYAVNIGGWQLDVAGVAAPVMNSEETAIAALCVAAPRYRTGRAWMRRVIPILIAGAAAITMTINGSSRARGERFAS
jgi:IclR family KDG regulon transcriptional repressor